MPFKGPFYCGENKSVVYIKVYSLFGPRLIGYWDFLFNSWDLSEVSRKSKFIFFVKIRNIRYLRHGFFLDFLKILWHFGADPIYPNPQLNIFSQKRSFVRSPWWCTINFDIYVLIFSRRCFLFENLFCFRKKQ